VLTGFISIGCAVDSEETEFQLPPDYQWCVGIAFDYSIAYPESWILVPEGSTGLGEEILSVVMMKYDPDMILGSISVSVSSDYDLDEALERGAEEKITNGMKSYHLLLEDFFGTTQKLVIFPADERYYIVQFFASSESYGKHTEVFRNAIDSFTLTVPEEC